MRTIDSEFPFEAEIAFLASAGVLGDDGQKQGAVLDLLANRGIPGIAATQFAQIEPNLYAGIAQRFTNPQRRFAIVGSVTDKGRFIRFSRHCVRTPADA
jgi:hypothetical protein